MLRLHRRDAIKALTSALAWKSLPSLSMQNCSAANPASVRSELGLVMYCVRIRREALRAQQESHDLFEPLALLKHCQQLGAGGMQCSLGVLTAQQIKSLRHYAEQNRLYIEAIIGLPKSRDDVAQFSEEMRSAKDVGALTVRSTIMSGRRYEMFNTWESYRQQAQLGSQMLKWAVPVAEKYQLPIAIENHKDQRNDERLLLLQEISSEFIGACLDTGNSLALLEDPLQTIHDFAPWAHSIHLKDQSLELVEGGFLLGDVPLGQGSLDMMEIVRIIRTLKPNIRFSLELITRDALHVPCLTEDYWTTLPTLPASQLARTLRYIQQHRRSGQAVSQLSRAEQLALEDQNVRESLQYAQQTLRL